MDENQDVVSKDNSAYDDLLTEGNTSKKKKKGIITLAIITAAWVATWVIFKTPLFGWIPAVIILVIVRTVFQDKPKKFSEGRLRRK